MIKSFTRKPIMIRAIQWDGKQETFDFIKSRIPSLEHQFKNAIKISDEKVSIAEIGDYVILEKPYTIISKVEFENDYQE